MVPRRTNFGERSEPAPDRGGKLQSAGGGAAQSNVLPLVKPNYFTKFHLTIGAHSNYLKRLFWNHF